MRNRFRAAGCHVREVLVDRLQRRIHERLARERNRGADKLLVSDYLTAPIAE